MAHARPRLNRLINSHKQPVNRTVIDRLDELLATLKSYCGHEIGIVESLSRSRDIGHDRHFSTRIAFFMLLRDVGVAFSGTSLTLDGEATGRSVYYQIALDAVVSANVESNAIVFIERFEEQTERRSKVTVAK